MRRSWTWTLILAALIFVPISSQARAQDLPSRAGGPDGFGYTYITSGEAGGPTYSWVGITGAGVNLNLGNNGEADTSNTVYDYNFYGQWYDIFRLGNNGGVLVGPTTLSTDDISANNQALPQVTHPIPVLFPFWDDMDDNGSNGDVYWAEFSSCPHPHSNLACMVFEWYNLPHSFNIGLATFEAILFTNGDVVFQYQDVSFGSAAYDWGASATVGIEDDDQQSNYYLQYSFNQGVLSNSLAILFESPLIFADGFETGNMTAWSSP